MNNVGDTSECSDQDGRTYDPPGYLRVRLLRHALTTVMALIGLGALAVSVPYWDGSGFPVPSLVVYVAGMVFVTMPLCMYYESLLLSHRQRTAQAKRQRGAGFGESAGAYGAA